MIDEASEVVTEYATALRASLMSLPSRVAQQLSGLTNPASIRQVLTEEINLFLEACEEFFGELYGEADESTSSD